MVDAKYAPLEESLKAMLVDIVRRCQSTVVQNYERIKPAPSVEGFAGTDDIAVLPLAQESLDNDPGTQLPAQSNLEGNRTDGNAMQLWFDEPPLLTMRQAQAFEGIAPSYDNCGQGISDSGYESFPCCTCSNRKDEVPSGKW